MDKCFEDSDITPTCWDCADEIPLRQDDCFPKGSWGDGSTLLWRCKKHWLKYVQQSKVQQKQTEKDRDEKREQIKAHKQAAKQTPKNKKQTPKNKKQGKQEKPTAFTLWKIVESKWKTKEKVIICYVVHWCFSTPS